MKWRVIKVQEFSAAMNMALDEAIANEISAGNALPTIRFYSWNPSAVSIGYFQSLNEEVNLDKCKELGFDVVRRRTGAGAVYHDREGEITYSVIGKEELFPKGITESYVEICSWIVNSLKEIGIESNFHKINDIIAGGKKISGNAQTRRNGVLQMHGTILYDLDVETMFSVLKVSKEKISDKLIQSVKDRVTRVLDFKNISRKELEEALIKGFTKGKEFEFGNYSETELKNAEKLVEEKYGNHEWNFKR